MFILKVAVFKTLKMLITVSNYVSFVTEVENYFVRLKHTIMWMRPEFLIILFPGPDDKL